ncbi:MAG TPA: hypothetical protein VGI74_14035 [Streptosporangiaceae bacterium]
MAQQEGAAPKAVPPWWEPYAAEFPSWTAWRAVSGLVYARKDDTSPPVVVHGEDPVDLRDQIIRAEAHLEHLLTATP